MAGEFSSHDRQRGSLWPLFWVLVWALFFAYNYFKINNGGVDVVPAPTPEVFLLLLA